MCHVRSTAARLRHALCKAALSLCKATLPPFCKRLQDASSGFISCRCRAQGGKMTGFRLLHVKKRPESGLDCLICAVFARQRPACGTRFVKRLARRVKRLFARFVNCAERLACRSTYLDVMRFKNNTFFSSNQSCQFLPPSIRGLRRPRPLAKGGGGLSVE